MTDRACSEGRMHDRPCTKSRSKEPGLEDPTPGRLQYRLDGSTQHTIGQNRKLKGKHKVVLQGAKASLCPLHRFAVLSPNQNMSLT